MTFHQHLVDQIDPQQLNAMKDQVFVFPTKRGGVFFKRALLKKFVEQNFMLPAILSIEEFVEKMTGLSISDELTLLFELFDIYQKKDKDLTFDKFYAWGKIILKDYDEIDRYLANAQRIYADLQNLKEIDDVFGYSEEFREIISRYRKLTDRKDKALVLTEFLKIWKEVGTVYVEYQDKLLSSEKAYAGMLYRNLVTILEQDHFEHPFAYYHFCGFNALSISEERMIDALVKSDKAQTYWDYDRYYLDEKIEEAGNFLRHYYNKWPHSIWFNADSLKQEKVVRVHSVPKNMAQATLASQLAETHLLDGISPEKVAVVLADEKLLLPLLHTMPETIEKVNVTMGYPMRSTVIYDFVTNYLELMRRVKDEEERIFYTYDLKPFLSNPYAQAFFSEADELLNWLINERKTRIGIDALSGRINSNELLALLNCAPNWQGVFPALKKYFALLFYQIKAEDEKSTDQEFIYYFIKSLNQLNEYVGTKTGLGLNLIRKILQEHFRAAKIPFAGEPVLGLQVMGFLETRTLDFDRLIVVSANEGKLPAERNLNSYIPYGLRKVFDLPTFEEQDAIYAYHFKRLLQRAQKVDLIYDNSTSGDSTGELSRFILQLQEHYRDKPNIKLEKKHYAGQVEASGTPDAITIAKDVQVLAMLDRYKSRGEEGKYLSASSLTNYITCKLKFYLNNVAGFYEQDDFEEDIDARLLGLVVHEVLEELYQEWIDKEVTAAVIDHLSKRAEKVLQEVLKKNKVVQEAQALTGRDLVTYQVMLQMVMKVLQLDKKDTPFIIRGLERADYQKQVDTPTGKVLIGGSIDRMDQQGEILRIIDYKTGKVEFDNNQKKSPEEKIEGLFQDPKYKSAFQAYLYASLVQPQTERAIKVGITTMKKLKEGIQWLNNGRSISANELSFFDELLDGLVHEIYDPAISFDQTSELENCRLCQFKGICNR
jgi:CRISPR/Cas system-associated exonuclease Cas4 (RecB family)